MNPLYILPGMGADHRMYSGEWMELDGATFIDWPSCSVGDSIQELALRVIQEYKIPTGSIIVGTSLGGMVGCEIARLCHARKLILLGSAKDPSEIQILLKSFSLWLIVFLLSGSTLFRGK